MITTIRKKNSKVLSLLDTIEFLNLLRNEKLPFIARHFKITVRAAQYQRKKYQAFSEKNITEAIRLIERKIRSVDSYVPNRDFEKESLCGHPNITAFLKCHDCTFVVGEKEIDKAISILVEYKRRLEERKVTEIKI